MFLLVMFLLALFFLGMFIAFLALTDKLSRLTGRITQLEIDLKEIRKGQAPVLRGQEDTSEAASAPSGAEVHGQPLKTAPETGRPSQIHAERSTPSGLAQAALSPVAIPGKKEPSRSQQEWEQLIGGKFLNRIGALALIIGVGFFMKYAFDNDWISESVRVIIGLVFGLGILGLGMKTHKKGFQVFSQGIFGAGIAILYLSIYASFNFYHLLPQGVAFIAMAAITAIAFYLACRYDSLAIAFLGWGGGFLTPFLLSTGQANAPGLFSYLVLLNLGMIIALIKMRTWDILAPLSLVATAIIYFSWKHAYYQSEDLFTAIGFLIIMWGEYIGYHAICQARKIPNKKARYVAASFNVILLFLGLFVVIDSRGWMATASAMAGAAYLGLYLATYKHLINEKITQAIYLLAAIALVAVAIAVEFRDFEIIIGWSIEAAVLIWCGLFWKRPIVVQAALFLLGAAGFGLVTINRAFDYEPIASFAPLVNERALTFVILAAALGGGAYLLGRYKEAPHNLARAALQAACSIVIFTLITVETLDYFRHLMIGQSDGMSTAILHLHRNMILPSFWILFSLPLLWYGMVRRSAPVAVISAGVSLAAMIYLIGTGTSYAPIEHYAFAFNIRVLAVMIMLGALLIQGRVLAAHTGAFRWAPHVLDATRIAAVLLGLFLLTVEAWDIFSKSIASIHRTSVAANLNYDRLKNLQQLTLSGIWLLYSVVMMALGLWRRQRAVRILSIGLFGISILKIFTYDLSFLDTLYRIFSFIGLGVILLAVSYAYQRYKAVIFGNGDKSSPPVNTPGNDL